MTFEFRAHHPSAYFRFSLLLIVLVAVNLVIIALIFPQLKSANDLAAKSIILIVPWILLLLFPSVTLGIAVYRSFVKTYRFTTGDAGITIERMKKNISVIEKKFSWQEMKSIQLIDFEDNHYCNLKFADKKSDLVIHRESGDFENFFEALKQFVSSAIDVHD